MKKSYILIEIETETGATITAGTPHVPHIGATITATIIDQMGIPHELFGKVLSII